MKMVGALCVCGVVGEGNVRPNQRPTLSYTGMNIVTYLQNSDQAQTPAISFPRLVVFVKTLVCTA